MRFCCLFGVFFWFQYCLGLGDICISFIVALGLYLLVEAPVRKCFRELLMPTSGRRRSTVTPQNTFRENTIRETTLRENTLRESTVREHRAESSNESRLWNYTKRLLNFTLTLDYKFFFIVFFRYFVLLFTNNNNSSTFLKIYVKYFKIRLRIP